eukprot:gene7176-282_t
MKLTMLFFCLLALQATSAKALTQGGPPKCERSYISNGKENYSAITERFYPGRDSDDPDFGATFWYLFSVIQVANSWAGVKLAECYACSGYSPKTPLAGQTILIPPCTWAEGCRAVIPLNVTAIADDARLGAVAMFGGDVDAWIPGHFSSGSTVGPGESVYVGPCKSSCCDGIARLNG